MGVTICIDPDAVHRQETPTVSFLAGKTNSLGQRLFKYIEPQRKSFYRLILPSLFSPYPSLKIVAEAIFHPLPKGLLESGKVSPLPFKEKCPGVLVVMEKGRIVFFPVLARPGVDGISLNIAFQSPVGDMVNIEDLGPCEILAVERIIKKFPETCGQLLKRDGTGKSTVAIEPDGEEHHFV